MYSTNLHVTFGNSLFDGEGNCVGTSYGWEPGTSVIRDGEQEVYIVGDPSQTARDNAHLWSLAPEMAELLKEYAYSGDFNGMAFANKVYTLLSRLSTTAEE